MVPQFNLCSACNLEPRFGKPRFTYHWNCRIDFFLTKLSQEITKNTVEWNCKLLRFRIADSKTKIAMSLWFGSSTQAEDAQVLKKNHRDFWGHERHDRGVISLGTTPTLKKNSWTGILGTTPGITSKMGGKFFSVTSKWRAHDATSIDFDTTNKAVWGNFKPCVSSVWRACAHARATQMSRTPPVPFPPVKWCPKFRGRELNPNISFSTFRALPGYPGKIPGYPAKRVWFPGFRGTYRTFWPPPLHGKTHPTRKYPDSNV